MAQAAQNQIKIAFSGAPGVGKSTVVNELAKKIPANLTTAIVTDVARTLVKGGVKINGESEYEDYLAFLAVRFKDMLQATADVMFYERTLLDVLVFMQLNGHASGWLEKLTRELVQWQLSQFTIYFYIPIEFNAQNDGVRIADPAVNRKVDEITLRLLKEYRPDFVTLTGSVEERVGQAYAKLNEKLRPR